MATVVVGGTVSELSGGKFANGAKTAAYQFLFNQMGRHDPSAMYEAARKSLLAIKDTLVSAFNFGNGLVDGGYSVGRGLHRFGYQTAREFSGDPSVNAQTDLESKLMWEALSMYSKDEMLREQVNKYVFSQISNGGSYMYGYALGRAVTGAFLGGPVAGIGDLLHSVNSGVDTAQHYISHLYLGK